MADGAAAQLLEPGPSGTYRACSDPIPLLYAFFLQTGPNFILIGGLWGDKDKKGGAG